MSGIYTPLTPPEALILRSAAGASRRMLQKVGGNWTILRDAATRLLRMRAVADEAKGQRA